MDALLTVAGQIPSIVDSIRVESLYPSLNVIAFMSGQSNQKASRRQSVAALKRRQATRSKRRSNSLPFPAYIGFITHESPEETDFDVPRSGLRLLTEGQWRQLRIESGGPRGQCVENVEASIARSGGEICYGWLRKPNHCPNKRVRYGDEMLTAHAVWRTSDGELVEVTQGQERATFCLDPTIRSHPNVRSMIFVDSEATAILSAPVPVYRWAIPTDANESPVFHGRIEAATIGAVQRVSEPQFSAASPPFTLS